MKGTDKFLRLKKRGMNYLLSTWYRKAPLSLFPLDVLYHTQIGSFAYTYRMTIGRKRRLMRSLPSTETR